MHEPTTVNQACSLEDLLVLMSALIRGQGRRVLVSAPLIDLKQALSDVLVEGKKVIIVSVLTGHAKLQKTYVMIPVE